MQALREAIEFSPLSLRGEASTRLMRVAPILGRADGACSSEWLYAWLVPLKLTLPADLERRIAGLGDAIAAASADVVFTYLFGSASTGGLTPKSDVDIAIYLAPGADAHRARLAVARAAARQLGSDAVDVVLLNDAPISLAGRVLGGRQVLLDRDPFARHRYESMHARMFQDFRIREHRLLAERGAHG